MNDHLHSFPTRSYQLNITPYVRARYPRFRVRSDKPRRNIKQRGEGNCIVGGRTKRGVRGKEEKGEGEARTKRDRVVRTQPSETKRRNRTESARVYGRGKETALEALDGNHVRSGRDGRARGDEKRTLALRSFMKRRRRTAPERIVTGTRTIATSANAVANVNYHRENRAGLAYFKRPPLRSPVFFLREGQ